MEVRLNQEFRAAVMLLRIVFALSFFAPFHVIGCERNEKLPVLLCGYTLRSFENYALLTIGKGDVAKVLKNGEGTGMARKRIIENMKEFHSVYGNNGYVYRGDIHKYYYNINHEMAKDIMEYYMPQSTHWLIDRFIDSTDGTVGLALGNQINTFVSNLYLDGLDKFITGELGIEYYGRYADDFYLIHPSKIYLKYCEQAIREYLGTLHLELNPKSQIIPLKNGIKFTGFHYWASNRGIKINLINEKKREHRRKFNRLYKKVLTGELTMDALERFQRSWEQHASHATDKSSLNYYHKNMQNLRKNNERKKRK